MSQPRPDTQLGDEAPPYDEDLPPVISSSQVTMVEVDIPPYQPELQDGVPRSTLAPGTMIITPSNSFIAREEEHRAGSARDSDEPAPSQGLVEDVGAAHRDLYDGLPPSSQPSMSDEDLEDDVVMGDAENDHDDDSPSRQRSDDSATPRAGTRSLPDDEWMDEEDDLVSSSQPHAVSSPSPSPRSSSPPLPPYPEPCSSPPRAEPDPMPHDPLPSRWDGMSSSDPPPIPQNNDTDDAEDPPDPESEAPQTPRA